MSINSGWSVSPGSRRRFLALSLAAMGIFGLLLLRLWYLQLIRVDHYQALSERNRIRYVPISAPRGPIYDRDGELLVENRPAFGVSVLRQEVEDRDRLISHLAAFLGEDPEVLLKRWEGNRRFPKHRPLPIAEDISREALEVIQENSIDLPGVLVDVRPMRSYPYGEMAAHLFGYLGEITEAELQQAEDDGYRPGDFVGKSGLEKRLEPSLRGVAGDRLVEVNVKGKELRQLKTRDPVPGYKVYLTIDRDLQLAAEKAFGEQAGAAVVLDVKTGEVLAMVSRPSFDPALFARGISGQEWVQLLRNPRHPLQNKAIKGQYPPGSTFKIVTALAALNAGVASASTTVDCTGGMQLGNRQFRCWKKHGHGRTDLKKALKESCDVWFYQVALDLGIDRLSAMAKALGLGEPLGFPLEWEKGGLIPTRQWKKKRYNAGWYDGETVIASIGQGYVLATPLQMAVMTAAVASSGTVLKPQVVKRIEDLSGNVLESATPQVLNRVALSEADLKAVRRGLEAVLNEPGGTAWASRLEGLSAAGKTGTSQVVKLKEDRYKEKTEDIEYRFRDHALFVAYAPTEDPQIALCVVVEHGGSGSKAAAPIARSILASYFGIPTEPPEETPAIPGE
ncbi:penicillin-binding protein 2 [Desulfuromonas versatilis]|uniref:Beta-lactamase n=1 Tax=Desulfuromonas versatilis TaxID=2802975 RepID=A0ABM8HNF9_9BACT|nr:penicillin-binding protein 2 [Desulfuromonas versatilis]BCR04369.1 penicillin-binding protein 2 [Desulfuromonas versatilis]